MHITLLLWFDCNFVNLINHIIILYLVLLLYPFTEIHCMTVKLPYTWKVYSIMGLNNTNKSDLIYHKSLSLMA